MVPVVVHLPVSESGGVPPAQKAGSMFDGHLPVSALGDVPPSQKAGSVGPVVGHLLFASGDAPPSQNAGSMFDGHLPVSALGDVPPSQKVGLRDQLLDTCCLHQVMLLLHRMLGLCLMDTCQSLR